MKFNISEKDVYKFVGTRRSKAMEAKAKLEVKKFKTAGRFPKTINLKEAREMIKTGIFQVEIDV